MCGIWCCISTTCRGHCIDQREGTFDSKCSVCSGEHFNKQIFTDQNNFISSRGPDLSSSRCFTVSNDLNATVPPIFFHLVSHVLWTQGEKAQTQPYEDSNKFMIFNGDIYSFSGFSQDKNDVENPGSNQCVESKFSLNDGLQLFELLERSKSEDEICSILGNLQGPFAFIFIDASTGQLWFGRDFFGRESLLFSYNENENDNVETSAWNISSVSVFRNVYEIPTLGLYCLEMRTRELKLYPYNQTRESISALQQDFFSALKASGLVNVTTVCDITVDLHFSAKLKFPELGLKDLTQDNNSVLNCLVNEAKSTNSSEEFLKSSIAHLSYYVDSLILHLSASVKRRVYTLPPFCKNCMTSHGSIVSLDDEIKCNHSKVGVLFSGGLDSTVLAYLAADTLPKGSSLDLINVAFSKDDDFTNVPDRETAIASYKMLNERFKPQGKIINLVLVNVGKVEVEKYRRERIKHLLSPLKSVLDDSVGVCLWIAARGVGKLQDEEGGNNKVTTSYTSPIRVVLLGSGADELLGGYGRHRSAYEKSGWNGLGSEMQFDLDRISIRNMGRDNRIVSDHGICPRIPFLDEHVVDFLTSQCDLWVKCCPVNVGPLGSRGNGEKLLLRAVGAKLFGEQYLSLALFPKRAMQFGSRIAKLENSKEKGGDSCQRLL